jgi:hypothetical protein
VVPVPDPQRARLLLAGESFGVIGW